VDVDQFYGIEILEWPARIAEVALWLMDHQMNLKVSEAFGQLYQRLPLKKSPHIHCANALRVDWKQILTPAQCSYVLGNRQTGRSALPLFSFGHRDVDDIAPLAEGRVR
jgi:hypothetical protein